MSHSLQDGSPRVAACQSEGPQTKFKAVPVVSIVVPVVGVTNSISRILEGIPKKELQWRL